MRPAPSLGRRPALDGLRALAMSMVLAHHGVAYFAPAWRRSFASGGFLGVDVFFVLSGLLITALLLEEHDRTGGVALAAFWRRRVLRLLPALAVVLAAWTVVRAAWGAQDLAALLRIDAIVLSYSTNWFVVARVDTGEGLGQMWSLAVEGQFYLLWPLLVVGALRLGLSVRTQVLLLCGGIALVAVRRAVLWAASPSVTEVYFRTDTRVDGLLVGALAAVLWRSGRLRPQALRRLLVPALVLLLVAGQRVQVSDGWLYRGGFTVLSLVAAVATVAAFEPAGVAGRALQARPVRWLGKVSYGVYLWHLPVYTALSLGPVRLPLALEVVVGLAFTLALAELSWRLVERPAQALARRPPAPAGERSSSRRLRS